MRNPFVDFVVALAGIAVFGEKGVEEGFWTVQVAVSGLKSVGSGSPVWETLKLKNLVALSALPACISRWLITYLPWRPYVLYPSILRFGSSTSVSDSSRFIVVQG